ncbi:hypothetical protein ACFLZ1_02780 [Patescibacteria group bacterium]
MFFKIALILALILFLPGCFNKNSKKPISTQEQEKEASPVSEEKFSGSLYEIVKLGKSMACTWEKDDNNYGLSLIKGENYRSENTINGTINYLIYKDNCSYTWQENNGSGTVYCSQDSQENDSTSSSSEKDFPGGKGWENFDYECMKTDIDDDMFEPPTEIEFKNPLEVVPSALD